MAVKESVGNSKNFIKKALETKHVCACESVTTMFNHRQVMEMVNGFSQPGKITVPIRKPPGFLIAMGLICFFVRPG